MGIEFDPNVQGPVPPPNIPSGPQGINVGGAQQQIPQDILEEMEEVFDEIKSLKRLPAGRISILELSKLISDMIRKLKAILYASEFNNYDLLSNLFLENSANASQISGLYNTAYSVYEQWIDMLNSADAPSQAYTTLQTDYNNYNQFMQDTATNDNNNISSLNNIYNYYNSLTQQDVDNYPGGEAALLQDLNDAVDSYNNYVNNRPDVGARITEIENKTSDYNSNIDAINDQISIMNGLRGTLGLPPFSLLNKTSDVTPSPLHVTLDTQPHFTSPLIPVSPRATIDTATTDADKGLIANPTAPGSLPEVSLGELVSGASSSATALLQTIGLATSLTELYRRAIEEDNKFIDATNLTLLFPKTILGNVNPAFSEGIFSSSGDSLFLSLIFGITSNKIEQVFSLAIMMAVAQNENLPISSRAFARLIYSVLDILRKSSLLSANRAALTLAPVLGLLGGASSQVIDVAISLGFATVIGNLLSSGVTRSLVNGFINRIAFNIRTNARLQNRKVLEAERVLGEAVKSGNPELIGAALNIAIKENLKLAFINSLSGSLGLRSLGNLAAFSRAVSAAINITFAAVALAQLGRSMGLAALVPQFFSQVAGLSTVDILAGLTSGTRITDFLDNPINIALLKQTLLDTIVFRLGLNSKITARLINAAINSVVAKGSINNFDHLRAELSAQFRKVGFSALQANILTNEAMTQIRGNLGVIFLNAAFGVNFDKSFIAAGIVENLKAGNPALFAAMLSSVISKGPGKGAPLPPAGLLEDLAAGKSENATKFFEQLLVYAFDRAMEVGGFQTQREFRDRLYNQLKALGFSANDAMFLANSQAAFAINGTILPIYGAGDIAAITGALAAEAGKAFGISESAAKGLVDEALKNALNGAPFSSADLFNIALKEEFVKAATAMGYANAADVFETALASLTPKGETLNLAGLMELIGSQIQGALKGEIGAQMAKELRDKILLALFGGTTVDEIAGKEEKKPLSLRNQLEDLLRDLLKDKNREELIRMIKKLKELLASLMKPNATVGWLLQSLMDHPTTFISNLAMASQMKRSVDIPI